MDVSFALAAIGGISVAGFVPNSSVRKEKPGMHYEKVLPSFLVHVLIFTGSGRVSSRLEIDWSDCLGGIGERLRGEAERLVLQYSGFQ